MNETREEILNSAKSAMGRNCVICKKYDCDYSKSEERRTNWCEHQSTMNTDEHFHCFVAGEY